MTGVFVISIYSECYSEMYPVKTEGLRKCLLRGRTKFLDVRVAEFFNEFLGDIKLNSSLLTVSKTEQQLWLFCLLTDLPV